MIIGKIVDGEELEIPSSYLLVQDKTSVDLVTPSMKNEKYIINKCNEILKDILSKHWMLYTAKDDYCI